MWDGPFYRVRRETYEISFVPNAGEDLDHVCNVDMWVTFADGDRWSGTVFTLSEVQRLLLRWEETGEALAGRYFAVWDGLIVRDEGIDAMVNVIDHLVAAGEYETVLRPLSGCQPNPS